MSENKTRQYGIEITEDYIPILQDLIKLEGYSSLSTAIRDILLEKFSKSIKRRPTRLVRRFGIPKESLEIKVYEMNVPPWKKSDRSG